MSCLLFVHCESFVLLSCHEKQLQDQLPRSVIEVMWASLCGIKGILNIIYRMTYSMSMQAPFLIKRTYCNIQDLDFYALISSYLVLSPLITVFY